MLNGPMTQPELQGARIFAAVGVMIAAGMPQHVHVHREVETRQLADTLDHLCHAGPYANRGEDTRALQLWLGHRSIQHTVRYSELSAERFRDW